MWDRGYFRGRGMPPPSGTGCSCRCGVRREGVPALSPARSAFSLLFCPHPPDPLPGGKGETFSLFRRGLRPRHPCTEPPTALIVPAKQVPSAAGSLRFGAKPIEHAFLWAVPVAKERGDRGRGTSAFEMVLSPGAGIASAGRVQSSCGYHSGRVGWRQTRLAPAGAPPLPPVCK